MSETGPSSPQPREALLVIPPRFSLTRRRETAKEAQELRRTLRGVLQRIQDTDAGRAAMARVRPIIFAGRLPGQWWGALTWRPLILVNPSLAGNAESLMDALAHEYGHCLFQVSIGSRIVDSLEQERTAEHLKASIWVERRGREDPEYDKQAGWILEQPLESVYERIRGWGSFYARLPEQQPRWYEVKKWWPVIRYWLFRR